MIQIKSCKIKTEFEKLCEEISNKNNFLDQGVMENHLRELRKRKINSKKEKELIKKEIQNIEFVPEDKGFEYKEENEFDEYIRKLEEKKKEEERLKIKRRYKIIIDSNKNFTKKFMDNINKKNNSINSSLPPVSKKLIVYIN
jgi:hypothetical protein